MKTYVLTLSQKFPAKHPKHGEPTNFNSQLLNAVWRAHNMSVGFPQFGMKLHTIRANYDRWRKRFAQIEAGKAILSVRYWTGKPYASKQVEFAQVTKEHGVGIQMLTFGRAYNPKTDDWDGEYDLRLGTVDDEVYASPWLLAKNDGLDVVDWADWFKNYDLSKPMAIIHFTKFRY